MELPNIYKGNYSLLILVPLVLVIISLLLTPRIPMGIELKGGMTLDLQLNKSADVSQIQSVLYKLGINDATVTTYTNPEGNVAEIDFTTDQRMNTIDADLSTLESLSNQVSTIETTQARLSSEEHIEGTNNSAQIASLEQQETSLIQQAENTQSDIFKAASSLAGTKLVTQAATTGVINDMEKASNSAFTEAKNDYQQGLLTSLAPVAPYNSYTLDEISPSLSSLFLSKVFSIAIISELLAIVGVFLIFRTAIPSIAVLAGAICDVVIALGAMAVFQIPMTLVSFATLMMLVALSLDTDMMLTIKTVKRKEGTPRERAYDAFKTGFAMTSTVIMAFVALLILGIITQIPDYYQIGAVATAGLIGDLIATWMSNAVLVLWYMEGQYGKFFSMVKR